MRLWTALLIIGFCPQLFAQLTYSVHQLDGTRRQPLNAQTKSRLSWTKGPKESQILTPMVALTAPVFAQYKEARGQTPSTRAVLKGNQLMLRLDGFSEVVELTAPNKKLLVEVSASWKANDPTVDSGCHKLGVAINRGLSKVPFYLGTHCVSGAGGVQLAVTLPREAVLTETSLKRVSDEGPPWVLFELGDGGSKAASGSFDVEFKGEKFSFSIGAPAPKGKAKAKAAKRKGVTKKSHGPKIHESDRTLVSLGVGLAFLSMSEQPDWLASDLRPLVSLKAPHIPLWGDLGVAANVDFAVPVGFSEEGMSYHQLELYASYEFKFLSRYWLRPKAGFVMLSHQHPSSGVGLSVSQIAVGGSAGFLFTDELFLAVDFVTYQFGSELITNQYAVAVSIERIVIDSVGWGVGARVQDITAYTGLGGTRGYSQIGFFGLVSF